MPNNPMSRPPTNPPWVMFLGSAVRLVDLHDTGRSPGSVFVVQPPEERRGNSQGLYVTVGWRLLEELREQELAGSHDFTDMIPFARQIAADFGITEEDVKQVINLLSTRTLMQFMDCSEAPPRPKSTRKTALIDRMPQGYRCRLTRTGREALQFAGGYLKWVHIPHEARKLITDLEMFEFASFLNISRRILLQIADQSAEIIKALEQPDAEALREDFTRHHDRYLATLEETAEVMRQCQARLRQREVVEKIEEWTAGDPEHGATVEHFFHITREVNSAALALQRRFSRFLSEVQQRSRSFISGVRFEEMARHFVGLGRCPQTKPDTLEAIFGRLGPVSIEANHLYIMDLAQSVQRPRDRKRPPPPRLHLRNTRSKPKPILEQFIEANKAVLLGILDQGPLRLSEFFEDTYELDWSALGEDGRLVDALGVFTSPLTMNIHGERPGKAIRITPLPMTQINTPDGWRVSGHAVELRLVDLKAARGTPK